MVSFRNFATIAFAAVAVAHSTPAEVVSNMDLLTLKCQTLQGIAHTVEFVHDILASGPVPHVIAGLHDIVSTVAYDLHHMEGMPAVEDGPDAEAISESFHHVCFDIAFLTLFILTNCCSSLSNTKSLSTSWP